MMLLHVNTQHIGCSERPSAWQYVGSFAASERVSVDCKVIASVPYPNFDILLLASAQGNKSATRRRIRAFQANRQQYTPFAGAACSSFCESLQQLSQKLPAKAE
ncbi:hypothetical protein ABBQ32_007536 [Trebouxia sp. C0010 RCD-2024]